MLLKKLEKCDTNQLLFINHEKWLSRTYDVIIYQALLLLGLSHERTHLHGWRLVVREGASQEGRGIRSDGNELYPLGRVYNVRSDR